MARYIFTGIAKDRAGNVMGSATCTVYLAGTTTAASVYVAATGGSAVSSVTSGTDGSYVFYVDDTIYYQSQKFKIQVAKPSFHTNTYDKVAVFPVLPITQVATKPGDAYGSNGDILIYEA